MNKLLVFPLRIYGLVIDCLREVFYHYKNYEIRRQCGGGISYPYTIRGIENITIAKNSRIGPNAIIYTTDAKVIIKEHVITGPGLTIISGDHKYMVDKWINEVRREDKDPENDQDVLIERDVWVGANVTILKGVTIGESSIVAAGALVIKDVPPYSIVGGVPAKMIKMKWNEEEIKHHKYYMDTH